MPFTQAPEEISLSESARLLENREVVMIDCREPDEHVICQIPGSLLLPLSTWADSFPTGFPSKDEAVVILCHHGMRSLRATRWLRQQGHENVRSVTGGIDGWARELDPALTRY